MSEFEDRLRHIEEKRRPAPPPSKDTGPVTSFDHSGSDGLGFRGILMLPIGVALGALAVVFGGVLKVAVIDGGLSEGTPIPPQLGVTAFIVALVLSTLADRVIGLGAAGKIAVTVGFIGMMWGEGLLAERFPATWIQLYQAEYLAFALGERGYEDLYFEPFAEADTSNAGSAPPLSFQPQTDSK